MSPEPNTTHEGQMTVGLYLNKPFPIMISDCLALPPAGSMQLFNPSNIENYDGLNGELATLVSKYIYVDKNTILTFAGKYPDIKKFADRFPEKWKGRDRNLRPMQFLHQLDNQLRAVRPGWGCSVLGASVVPNSGEAKEVLMNNYASFNDNWMFNTNNFGRCYAIGTGSDQLRKFVENAEKNIDRIGSAGDRFLFKLLGALNGTALFAQHEEADKQTWGGLLQAQIYHPKAHRWLRTPPWFHMYVFFEGKEMVFKGIHRKTVLHTSIPDELYTSAVITYMEKDDGSNMEAIVWPVFSTFASAEKRGEIELNQAFVAPEFITITSSIAIDGKNKVYHNTYPTILVKGVYFKKHSSLFGWNIERNELGGWLRQKILNDPSIELW